MPPLTVSTRIGPYEITGTLGAGGMGEVYRARDTKLGRDVALKVISDAFALDPDRLARFQREAQLLASLNHPHIGAIYGFEDSGATHALVLELVEGDTLADRIARGPLPLDEALPIARQIAEALEAAHEHGIIHRDLKPANIKVTPDGVVKVLDFGLAKMLEAGGAGRSGRSGGELTNSPTITSPFGAAQGGPAMMTGVGAILGTAAYMSPEQAKGREADKRSDIWAFGCVLYEMLTGRGPFAGDDVSDTLANVLKREPDLSVLPADVPPAIRALVQRCLVKDRRQRIGDIAVAQFLLTGNAGFSTENAPQLVERELTRKGVLPIAAAVVLTAVVVGASAWLLRPAAAPPSPVVRFTVPLPEGQQFSSLTGQVVAISPDGTKLVYAADSRLYLRSIGVLDAQPIPGTNLVDLRHPVFSPDGGLLAFYDAVDGTIKRIPVSGGTPATIVHADNLAGMSWGQDWIVFGTRLGGISRVSPDGGEPEQLVSVEAGQQAYGPQILPGGESVLFTLATGTDAGRWDAAHIVVQSLKSRVRKTIVESGSDGRYLPSGHLVYAVSGSLFAVAFDPATHTVGRAKSVLVGVGRSFPPDTSGAAKFAVSDTGSLVYAVGPADSTGSARRLVLGDRNGVTTPLKVAPGNYAHPRVSPNGARLAVGLTTGQEAHVWIYDLAETSSMRRLTLTGRNRYPVWSGDGLRVAYQSDRDGDLGIFSQSVDGESGIMRLTTPPKGVAHVPESWSPDGKHLLFTERRGADYVLFVLSIADKTATPFGEVRSIDPTSASFSPNGQWVAYSFTDQGGLRSAARGVFIQPFPATGARFPVPKTRLDFHPAWAANGQELFYVPSAFRPFVAVSVRTEPGVVFGVPAELSEVVERPQLISSYERGYDVTPDGRFLSSIFVADGAAGAGLRQEIGVVVNWFDELERLVPTR